MAEADAPLLTRGAATLNVKNLPDGLYRKLQARARREHRSVAQQVTEMLSRARGTRALDVGLKADLGTGAVAADTAVFVYFIEEDPRFLPLVLPLVQEADRGERLGALRVPADQEPRHPADRCDPRPVARGGATEGGSRNQDALGDVRRRILLFLGDRAFRTEDGVDALPVREFLDELEAGRI